MSRDLSDITGALLPAGICSAPPYLHFLFNRTYGDRGVSQVALAERVDRLLEKHARIFLENTPKTGEALQAFMYDLLAAYKCENGKNPADLLPKIIQQNRLESPTNLFTTFSFCEALNSPAAPGRELVNFVTMKRIYTTCFSNKETPVSASINVKEFCERAHSFFDIHLEYNANIQNLPIARIALERDPRGSDHRFFVHHFCYLAWLTPEKEDLYSLYSQLLGVIYTEKAANEDEAHYQKRKLNAIFLLAFLIGSNPPLYNVTGGAFVSDAMLQILLLSAGFTPIQKNFLSLTEIELLLYFSSDTPKLWHKPQKYYWAAEKENASSCLFHPQSEGPEQFLDLLTDHYFQKLFHIKKNETVEHVQARQKRLQSIITKVQGNPDRVYQECYDALILGIRLFMDNFNFQNDHLLESIERHFHVTIPTDGYLIGALLACGKLTPAQHAQISAQLSGSHKSFLAKFRSEGARVLLNMFVREITHDLQKGDYKACISDLSHAIRTDGIDHARELIVACNAHTNGHFFLHVCSSYWRNQENPTLAGLMQILAETKIPEMWMTQAPEGAEFPGNSALLEFFSVLIKQPKPALLAIGLQLPDILPACAWTMCITSGWAKHYTSLLMVCWALQSNPREAVFFEIVEKLLEKIPTIDYWLLTAGTKNPFTCILEARNSHQKNTQLWIRLNAIVEHLLLKASPHKDQYEQMARAIKTSNAPLLPPGICSAPSYLHFLFNHAYDDRGVSQVAFAELVDRLLDRHARIFLENTPKTGEALQTFMCNLLAWYRCEEGKNPSDLLPLIAEQNQITGKNRYTIFSDCRTAIHLVSIKNMYETCFSNPSHKNHYITLETFCLGAAAFFGIHLDYNFQLKNHYIAVVSFQEKHEHTLVFMSKEIRALEKNKVYVKNFDKKIAYTILGMEEVAIIKAEEFPTGTLPDLTDLDAAKEVILSIASKRGHIDSNYYFTHHFSYFIIDTLQKKEQLYSLYTQLLNVIYGKNNNKTRKLNAIFLLAFLIGSNPQLLNDSGGAFVADAMLQILLISAEFPPVKKNFLGLTEIELLLFFGSFRKEMWDQVQAYYWAAVNHHETNFLFHPESADADQFLRFLTQPSFNELFSIQKNGDVSERKKSLQTTLSPKQKNPEIVYKQDYIYILLGIFRESYDARSLNITHDSVNQVFRLLMEEVQKYSNSAFHTKAETLLKVASIFIQAENNLISPETMDFKIGIAYLLDSLRSIGQHEAWDYLQPLLAFSELLTEQFTLVPNQEELIYLCEKLFDEREKLNKLSTILEKDKTALPTPPAVDPAMQALYCENPENQTLLTIAQKNPDALPSMLRDYWFTDIDLRQAITTYVTDPLSVSIFDEDAGSITQALLLHYRDKQNPIAFSTPFLLCVGNNHWIAVIIEINTHEKHTTVISADSLAQPLKIAIYTSAIRNFFAAINHKERLHISLRPETRLPRQQDGSSCGAWAILNLLKMIRQRFPDALSLMGKWASDPMCRLCKISVIPERGELELKKAIAEDLLRYGAFLKSIATQREDLLLAHRLFFATDAIETRFNLDNPAKTKIVFNPSYLPADITPARAETIANRLYRFYSRFQTTSFKPNYISFFIPKIPLFNLHGAPASCSSTTRGQITPQ